MSAAFFIVVFSIMEFSRMIWQHNVVASAAKDGARWAAVRGSSSGAPATEDDVQTYVQGRAYGLPVTVTTLWSPGDKSAGSIVTVRVQRSFQPVVPILPQGLITLRSSAQMLIAR